MVAKVPASLHEVFSLPPVPCEDEDGVGAFSDEEEGECDSPLLELLGVESSGSPGSPGPAVTDEEEGESDSPLLELLGV
jgi:hypothetical protein